MYVCVCVCVCVCVRACVSVCEGGAWGGGEVDCWGASLCVCLHVTEITLLQGSVYPK